MTHHAAAMGWVVVCLARPSTMHVSIDGVRQIKLGVNATNMAAKALYQSMGFERFGVEPDALNVDGRFYDEEHYMLRLSSSD